MRKWHFLTSLWLWRELKFSLIWCKIPEFSMTLEENEKKRENRFFSKWLFSDHRNQWFHQKATTTELTRSTWVRNPPDTCRGQNCRKRLQAVETLHVTAVSQPQPPRLNSQRREVYLNTQLATYSRYYNLVTTVKVELQFTSNWQSTTAPLPMIRKWFHLLFYTACQTFALDSSI